MGFRWGFKTEANDLATEVRCDLHLDPLDPLDPRDLAKLLEIPIVGLSDLVPDAPSAAHFLLAEPEAFSAATVFRGSYRTIVHNDSHAPVRQNSNLAHELAHGLLQHPPHAALDCSGCRSWDQDLEDEAHWLCGVLLVSEAAALAIAKGQWTQRNASQHFRVSEKMIQYRLNTTGAVKRVQRARQARR